MKFRVTQYIPLVGDKHIEASKGAMITFGLGGGQKAHVDFSSSDNGADVPCSENTDAQ